MTTGYENTPGAVGADGTSRLHGVVLAGSDDVVDLTIEAGRVSAIRESARAAEWVCLPPLADLHVHANRAFTPPESRPRGLEDAVRKVAGVFDAFTAEDYRRHAGLLFDAAFRHGTTRLRTHADINPGVGLDTVTGSLQAAADFAGAVEVEVVAFAASGSDPATAAGRDLLREAISLGAHYVGAAPAFCTDPAASIDAILDLAVELSVPVDLHLDEHLDASRSFSGHLADATIDRGLTGRVTLGHACAISTLAPPEQARVIDTLARAEITVIALPRTNLYLQDSGDGGDIDSISRITPTLRGVTSVSEMLAAGVAIRFASDNVRDAFYPYGDADLLGVAMDGILATQVDDPRSVVAAICDGRHSLAEGDPADMVLLPGASVDAVLADAPAQRWLCRAGIWSRAGERPLGS